MNPHTRIPAGTPRHTLFKIVSKRPWISRKKLIAKGEKRIQGFEVERVLNHMLLARDLKERDGRYKVRKSQDEVCGRGSTKY